MIRPSIQHELRILPDVCPVISAKDMVNSLLSPCGKFSQRNAVYGMCIHTTMQIIPTSGFKWSGTSRQVWLQTHSWAHGHGMRNAASVVLTTKIGTIRTTF